MTVQIPTPLSLNARRARMRGEYETGLTLYTTSSSRTAEHAIETIVGRMQSDAHLDGYVYDGLNARNARKVFAAFKRVGWVCEICSPRDVAANRVGVFWPRIGDAS